MASVFVSTPAEVVVVDSRTRSGFITLPTTNSIPYRTINFKDQYGTFSNSTLTLSTQLGESFDDGTTSKTFSNAFSYLSLYAVSSKWMVMNATQTVQQTISSLTVNQLQFGTGAGWIQFGPIQTPIVSSIQIQTNDSYVNNQYIGGQSTVNDIMYWGLFGNYNNTALAEISTGAGTQEFLIFRGSSTSDRIRMQTTGNFVVETGVSARLWSSNNPATTISNATPAFIINTSSNVGIQTATPGATLDVAGTIRGMNLSSQQLFVSSINGFLPIYVPNLNSTVQGLGSASYVSSLSLVSTTAGIQIQFQTSGFLSTPNLTSTVAGLGSAGYASTSFVGNAISTFSTALGPGGGVSQANLTSTVAGLGSASYVSSSQLISTVAGLASGTGTPGFPSTVSTSYSIAFNTSSLTTSTINFVNILPSPSNLWVAVGIDFGNVNNIKYSYNGRSWFDSVSGTFTTSGNAVAYNGRIWVAVGSGGNSNSNIKYSFDGLNWLNSLSGGFFFSGSGVAWNGRMWVATGNDLTAAARVKYSFDGLNWSNSSGAAFTSDAADVAWNGTMWVAVGSLSGGNSNETIKYSYDGISWSNSSGIGFNQAGFFAASAVAWNGSIWVAVGFDSGNGTIKYSVNGINWSNSLSGGFTSYGSGVAWNGQIWVAVGSGGSSNANIKYSFDGLNWLNSLSGGFTSYGTGISWNGTLWVAAGTTSSGSQLKYSSDGVNWIDSFFNSFTNGNGIGFSSNTLPSYNQNNLSILPQNIPIFLTSTNTILAQPSSLIINNTLEIDRTWNRIGINCNIPNYSLDVAGSLNTSSFFINTSSFTNILTSTVAGIPTGLTTGSLTSTVQGLGSASYISSLSLVSTTAGIQTQFQTAGFLSTPNLTSTVAGLGSAGYASTSYVLQQISSFSTALGAVGGGGISQTVLTSTVIGLGTIGYISTPGGGTGVQTSNLTSTVQGLGSAGYASTAQSQYSLFTVRSGTSYTGEPWTEQLMSLSNLGLFNAPVYLEPDNITLRVSTATTMLLRVSYMTGGNNNTLTTPRPTITMALSTPTDISYFPSVENFEGGGGSVSFIQNFDAASRLLFYMRGLSNYTFGTIDGNLYRMTFETVAQTQTLNVLSNLSSLSSIINNLYTQNTRVTTEFIVERSSITTSAFAVDMTARNANVQNSTTTFSMFADTSRTLNSSISRAVHTDFLRVMSNAIIGCNSVIIRDDTVFASSVQVSTVNILDQSTMRFVPLSISSGSIYLNNVLASAGGGGSGGGISQTILNSTIGGLGTLGYISTQSSAGGSTLSSLFVGSSSNQNFIKFWGSIGEYNNTAIVQQSTGGGTNEFLFFEGSSINDQIRLQTTGNIRFEAGVPGPRNVNNAIPAVTPTMIINSSSNVGINTGNPTFNLDVAGSGRFQTLMSTVQVFSGALYLGVFFA